MGRAVLFMIGCAAALAVAAPLMPGLPKAPSLILLEATTATWAFMLTILFVRLEGFRLDAVGVI